MRQNQCTTPTRPRRETLMSLVTVTLCGVSLALTIASAAGAAEPGGVVSSQDKQDKLLGRMGAASVSAADVRALNLALTDGSYDDFRRNPSAYTRSVEEIATWRNAQSVLRSGTFVWSDREKIALDIALARAAYNAALASAEQRGRSQALTNPEVLRKRARELYETADTDALKTPLAADVQVITFDVDKHPVAELFQRIQAAQLALKTESSDFGAIVERYSDDEKTRTNKGKIDRLSAASAPDLVSRVVFAQMKEGEVSPLLSQPNGLMLMKLVKRYPPERRPYDSTIQAAALVRAEQEAGQLAREAMRIKLIGDAKLETYPDAIREQLFIPDPAALEQWRTEQEKAAKRPAQ